MPRKEPYSGMSLENKLFNEDCLTFMQKNDFKVNYILTSPPDYEDRKTIDKDYNTYMSFIYKMIQELVKHSDVITISITDRKKDGKIIHKHGMITEYFEYFGFYLKTQKIWVKSFKTNLFSPNYSFLLTFVRNGHKANKKLNNSPDCYEGKQSNPRHMNSTICETLINLHTEEGDIIYDPCMGSGTTAIACRKLKRKYIGTELVKEIYDDSIQRLLLQVKTNYD